MNHSGAADAVRFTAVTPPSCFVDGGHWNPTDGDARIGTKGAPTSQRTQCLPSRHRSDSVCRSEGEAEPEREARRLAGRPCHGPAEAGHYVRKTRATCEKWRPS